CARQRPRQLDRPPAQVPKWLFSAQANQCGSGYFLLDGRHRALRPDRLHAGQANLNVLLAVEHAEQQHDPLLAIHRKEDRLHVGELPHLDLLPIAGHQQGVVRLDSATLLEVIVVRIPDPTGLSAEPIDVADAPGGTQGQPAVVPAHANEYVTREKRLLQLPELARPDGLAREGRCETFETLAVEMLLRPRILARLALKQVPGTRWQFSRSVHSFSVAPRHRRSITPVRHQRHLYQVPFLDTVESPGVPRVYIGI